MKSKATEVGPCKYPPMASPASKCTCCVSGRAFHQRGRECVRAVLDDRTATATVTRTIAAAVTCTATATAACTGTVAPACTAKPVSPFRLLTPADTRATRSASFRRRGLVPPELRALSLSSKSRLGPGLPSRYLPPFPLPEASLPCRHRRRRESLPVRPRSERTRAKADTAFSLAPSGRTPTKNNPRR